MKKVYLTVGITFAVVGIIIAFQNMFFNTPIWILFFRSSKSMFVPLIIILCVGFISGGSFALGLSAKKSMEDSDYDL